MVHNHERALEAARALRERQPTTLALWRFAGDLSHGLILPVLALLMLLALGSYSPQDPAWSHSSSNAHVLYQNTLGVAGAWFADVALGLFGYLAYAMPVLLLLCSLNHWLTRQRGVLPAYVGVVTLVVRWLGFVFAFCTVLLCGSLLARALISDAALLQQWQGVAGSGLAQALVSFGASVAFFVVLGLLSLSVTMLFDRSYSWLLEWVGWPLVALFERASSGLDSRPVGAVEPSRSAQTFDRSLDEDIDRYIERSAAVDFDTLQRRAQADTVVQEDFGFSARDDDETAAPVVRAEGRGIEPTISFDEDEISAGSTTVDSNAQPGAAPMTDEQRAIQAAQNFALDERDIASLRLHYSDTQSLAPLPEMQATGTITVSAAIEPFAATDTFAEPEDQPSEAALQQASTTTKGGEPDQADSVPPAVAQPVVTQTEPTTAETADEPTAALTAEGVSASLASVAFSPAPETSALGNTPRWPIAVASGEVVAVAPPVLEETVSGSLADIPLLDQTLVASAPVADFVVAASEAATADVDGYHSDYNDWAQDDYDSEVYANPLKVGLLKTSEAVSDADTAVGSGIDSQQADTVLDRHTQDSNTQGHAADNENERLLARARSAVVEIVAAAPKAGAGGSASWLAEAAGSLQELSDALAVTAVDEPAAYDLDTALDSLSGSADQNDESDDSLAEALSAAEQWVNRAVIPSVSEAPTPAPAVVLPLSHTAKRLAADLEHTLSLQAAQRKQEQSPLPSASPLKPEVLTSQPAVAVASVNATVADKPAVAAEKIADNFGASVSNVAAAPIATASRVLETKKPEEESEAAAAATLVGQGQDARFADIFASDPSLRRLSRNCSTAVQTGDVGLPSIALLSRIRDSERKGFSEEALQAMSRLLEEKLNDFGVQVKVVDVLPGPVITRFDILPAPGIKASRITSLSSDLARSLAVTQVRVLEVIPGKSCVGIEVPNAERETVRLGDVLASDGYQQASNPLTLALGYDIAGLPVIADLAKMPHLLVAGTTGSGKSVGINTMLLSLLFKANPEDVRLILVDPKQLELALYDRIPHLLTPVITDMNESANALRWAVGEMERRYQLMAKLGVRNLAGYNEKVRAAEEAGQPLEDPIWTVDPDDTGPGKYVRPYLCRLPSIVIVIDEFADMMIVTGKKCEQLITRIAQKARAAGIHLILATQRPSVDVITGLIKANVPTRIAFTVSTKIDSRTILDQGGAEQLLGAGDMLYQPVGTSIPTRVHGAFVSDEEVQAVTDDWRSRGEPNYLSAILEEQSGVVVPGLVDDEPAASATGEADVLYDQALDFILTTRRASISLLQRRFNIGYNRAAKIIESMEAAGVLGPMGAGGGNSREILVPTHDD